MVQAMNLKAIETGTGKSWEEILAYLAGIGAEQLSHAQIAAALHEDDVARAWWAQTVTVAYEQQIGRREPGQDCNGEYQVSVSKTLTGTMDDALRAWTGAFGAEESFSGIGISRGPEASASEKWRYWRAGLADGSRVNVNIYEKSPGKAALTVQHERLESLEQLEHWRQYWKGRLKELG